MYLFKQIVGKPIREDPRDWRTSSSGSPSEVKRYSGQVINVLNPDYYYYFFFLLTLLFPANRKAVMDLIVVGW